MVGVGNDERIGPDSEDRTRGAAVDHLLGDVLHPVGGMGPGMTTFAPASANAFVVARPSPLDDAATSAVFPSISRSRVRGTSAA